MDKTFKLKLMCYLLISAVGFSYLVLSQNAGISVPIFAGIQFVCLYFLMPRKKPLLLFIPIFILSFNWFISANGIWRIPNLFVVIILYSVMALCMVDRLPIREVSSRFIVSVLENIPEPFRYFATPIEWCADTNKEHTKTIERVFVGIGISIPCLIFLLMMLSSSDQIFSNNVSTFFNWALTIININLLFKAMFGMIAGFYLFGIVYSVYQPRTEKVLNIKSINGDLIILNILLTSILAVYTIFVVIQFKYLFANGNNLPYGLTYTYYARRGFFELLLLTGLNVMLILITTWLTKEQTGKWAKFTKILCCYLCVVTIVLLISSFYRMWLYNDNNGLTRLRFLVFGFLIFEAIGLIFTFFYIIKQNFNVIAVYACIALGYYLMLNIVPMDAIIARDQVDRYFKTGGTGIEYTLTLSADAAPQIARLLESEDIVVKEDVREYFEYHHAYQSYAMPYWQRWNLSVNRFLEYRDELFK